MLHVISVKGMATNVFKSKYYGKINTYLYRRYAKNTVALLNFTLDGIQLEFQSSIEAVLYVMLRYIT